MRFFYSVEKCISYRKHLDYLSHDEHAFLLWIKINLHIFVCSKTNAKYQRICYMHLFIYFNYLFFLTLDICYVLIIFN